MTPPIELPLLDLQDQLQVRTAEGQRQVFDPIRRKWLALAPEELVRQLFSLYLIQVKNYNANRIGIEKTLKVNTLTRRFDLLIYSPDLQPWMLIECKAPSVKLSQNTFDQVARYNLPLRVPFLTVTNGLHTYCCAMDYAHSSYTFLNELPEFPV